MTLHLRQPMAEPATFETGDVTDRTDRPRGYAAKRLLDLVLVLICVPIVLPIVLGLAAAIFARDGVTPLYRQKRIGLNGRVFSMWKLRSMVPDAEARLEAHLAADPVARAEWALHQKLRHDPRITPIGRMIRKSSLDELPQLWNVLVGEMSLVGPRPMMVCQRDYYPGTAYYALRPGITGFWQTSVRNESSFHERAAFDADYLRRISLVTDVVVLLRTVRVVLQGTGY